MVKHLLLLLLFKLCLAFERTKKISSRTTRCDDDDADEDFPEEEKRKTLFFKVSSARLKNVPLLRMTTT